MPSHYSSAFPLVGLSEVQAPFSDVSEMVFLFRTPPAILFCDRESGTSFFRPAYAGVGVCLLWRKCPRVGAIKGGVKLQVLQRKRCVRFMRLRPTTPPTNQYADCLPQTTLPEFQLSTVDGRLQPDPPLALETICRPDQSSNSSLLWICLDL
jgi:hypothetical protein